jgi:hypothetical protein
VDIHVHTDPSFMPDPSFMSSLSIMIESVVVVVTLEAHQIGVTATTALCEFAVGVGAHHCVHCSCLGLRSVMCHIDLMSNSGLRGCMFSKPSLLPCALVVRACIVLQKQQTESSRRKGTQDKTMQQFLE